MPEGADGTGAAGAVVRAAPPPAARDESLHIAATIHHVRGEFVMLDRDVASVFGKPSAGVINQNRARNPDRFPESYAFQLTPEEWEAIRSATGERTGHGGARKLP